MGQLGLWITISFALLAILCVSCLLAGLIAARIAARTTALPRAELASLASKLRSIEHCQLESGEALTQLANRVKMQRVRNAINHTSDPPSADLSIKDELRKRAGLTAGKPARHQ